MQVMVPRYNPWQGWLGLVLALGLHASALYGLLLLRPARTPPVPVTWISLATLAPQPQPVPTPVVETPRVETPLPEPAPVAAVVTPKATVARQPEVKPEPKPRPKPQPKPKAKSVPTPRQQPPVATPVETAPPVAQTQPVPQPVATPLDPVIPARFNAAYLNNPAPAYPALARRLGEQGKVLLRAHVLPSGKPETVEIQESSGSQRLDVAARDAVARWQFIPARQGEVALAAWVVVPIHFHLER